MGAAGAADAVKAAAARRLRVDADHRVRTRMAMRGAGALPPTRQARRNVVGGDAGVRVAAVRVALPVAVAVALLVAAVVAANLLKGMPTRRDADAGDVAVVAAAEASRRRGISLFLPRARRRVALRRRPTGPNQLKPAHRSRFVCILGVGSLRLCLWGTGGQDRHGPQTRGDEP